jgi:HSP20 family protein
MALIPWQPFSELDTLRRQMDQLFDELMPNTRSSSNAQEARKTWVPAIEMGENDDSIMLRAEIPGVEAKDLDIQVTREAVSISGEHRYESKSTDKGAFRSELRYGKFQRMIPLPAQVKNDQVKADFKDGILTLTLPKVEEERRRVFKVNLAGSQPKDRLEAGNGGQSAEAAQAAEMKSVAQ